MFEQLAGWFHLLSSPVEYADEAVTLAVTIDALARREVRTVLELGSGGGNNASYLKRRYDMTLVDLSPGMLDLSRTINPECEHVEGDMRTVRLGRSFDAVLIHDAIMYLTTEEELSAAMATAAEHLEPGGVALFIPDDTAETFTPGTQHGGHDADDGRATRWLEWEQPAEGTTYTVYYAMVLREADGSMRLELDEHVVGLFPAATWMRLIEAAGLQARAAASPWHAAGMFAGIKAS